MPLTFDGTSNFAAALGGMGQFGQGLTAARESKAKRKSMSLEDKIREAQLEREPLLTEAQKLQNAFTQQQTVNEAAESKRRNDLIGLQIMRETGRMEGEKKARADMEANQKAYYDNMVARGAASAIAADTHSPGMMPSSVPEGLPDAELADFYAKAIFTDDEQEHRNIFTAGMRTLLNMRDSGATPEEIEAAKREMLGPLHVAVDAKRRQDATLQVNDLLAQLENLKAEGQAVDSTGKSFALSKAYEEGTLAGQKALDVIQQGGDPGVVVAQLREARAKLALETSRAIQNNRIKEEVKSLLSPEPTKDGQAPVEQLTTDQYNQLSLLLMDSASPNADPDELRARFDDIKAGARDPHFQVPGTDVKIYDPGKALWRGRGPAPRRGTATPEQRMALSAFGQQILRNDSDLRTAYTFAAEATKAAMETSMKLKLELAKAGGYDQDGTMTSQIKEAEAMVKRYSSQQALLSRFAEGQAHRANGFDAPNLPTETELMTILGLTEEPKTGVGLEDIQKDITATLSKGNLAEAARTLTTRYRNHPNSVEIFDMLNKELQARGKTKGKPQQPIREIPR